MAVELHIVPGAIVSREEFLKTHPPFSIGLDGYVSGEPFLVITDSGPYRNFNHHEFVDRSCTCATCEQVRRAIVLGLFELYQWPSGPRANLWVNDCDQDICLATWILMNPDRASEPDVRTLTNIEDLLDMSAGAAPVAASADSIGQVRWVFEPYVVSRPRLSGMGASEMREVIDTVHDRIDRFVRGKAEKVDLKGDFAILGGGKGWKIVEVDHQDARQKMIVAGINAAVELYARDDGSYRYSLWRRSEYIVGFPVAQILDELNRREGFEEGDSSGWGGSDNVGGSPRRGGSRLTPGEVEDAVNVVVDDMFSKNRFAKED